jgi:hypothetical protein
LHNRVVRDHPGFSVQLRRNPPSRLAGREYP